MRRNGDAVSAAPRRWGGRADESETLVFVRQSRNFWVMHKLTANRLKSPKWPNWHHLFTKQPQGIFFISLEFQPKSKDLFLWQLPRVIIYGQMSWWAKSHKLWSERWETNHFFGLILYKSDTWPVIWSCMQRHTEPPPSCERFSAALTMCADVSAALQKHDGGWSVSLNAARRHQTCWVPAILQDYGHDMLPWFQAVS